MIKFGTQLNKCKCSSEYYTHYGDSVSEYTQTRTYNLDRQGQQQVVDSLNKEVCPFTDQFWRQILQIIRWARCEELVQLHYQCAVLTHKELHPWVPQTAHILTGSLLLAAEKVKNSQDINTTVENVTKNPWKNLLFNQTILFFVRGSRVVSYN